MSHDPNPSPLEAHALAAVILGWHRRHGEAEWPTTLGDDQLTRYRAQLDAFADADLSIPGTRRTIAREQRGGAFERFAATPIDEPSWQAVSAEYGLSADKPSTLYAAAVRLSQLDGEEDDIEHPRHDEQAELRHTASIASQDDVIEAARTFYARLGLPDETLIGGVGALVSSSLQRDPLAMDAGSITLLHPHVLGLEVLDPITHSNDLRTLVLQGTVRIDGITGGSGLHTGSE